MRNKPHLRIGTQLGLALLALTAVFAGTASADPPARVGRLNLIDGSVSFRPASVEEWTDAQINRPLTTGDHIWTDSASRAEIHVGSTAIRLGPETDFDLLNLDDRTEQIRLAQGSLNIHIRYLDEDSVFEVDTPNSAISLLRTGVYRIDVFNDGDESRVTVRHGEAEVTTEGSAFAVRPYQTALVDGGESITYDIREALALDDWDDWCQRRDTREDHPASARYVSTEMVGYEDLDSYGAWRTVPDYGPVWVPTRVVVGWAPYHYGHWAWVYPWGWTWVDDAPWGFAPFHYGRWAYVGGAWGWLPGAVLVQRPVYAPALVAFVGGGGFGVSLNLGGGGGIGWFPLGPREVYYPAYHVSDVYVRNVNVTNVNVTNINVRNVNVTNVTYVNRTVPGAVTAVSTTTFVSSRSVSREAVRVSPGAIASAQVSGMTAPVAPTKVSVLAVASTGRVASAPPVTVMSRKVMVKETPPAPIVPFAARQKDLAAHPGVPEDATVLADYHKKEKAQNTLVKSAVVPTGPGGTPKLKPARAGITTATTVSGNTGKTGKTGGQTSNQTGTQTTGQTTDVVKHKDKGQSDTTGSETGADAGRKDKSKGTGSTQSGSNTTSGEVDRRKTTTDTSTGKPKPNKPEKTTVSGQGQSGQGQSGQSGQTGQSGQSGQSGEQGQGKNKNKSATGSTTTTTSTPTPKVKEEKTPKTTEGGQGGQGGQKNKENKDNKENKNKQKNKEGEKPNGEKQGGR